MTLLLLLAAALLAQGYGGGYTNNPGGGHNYAGDPTASPGGEQVDRSAGAGRPSGPGPQDYDPRAGSEEGPKEDEAARGRPDGGGQVAQEEPPAPVTLDDARVNFGTVVDAFLAQNTRDGVWNLRDKKTRKIRKLSFESIDEKSIKPASGGPARFRGLVTFKEAGAARPVVMEMTVDMSGTQWKVAGATLRRPQK